MKALVSITLFLVILGISRCHLSDDTAQMVTDCCAKAYGTEDEARTDCITEIQGELDESFIGVFLPKKINAAQEINVSDNTKTVGGDQQYAQSIGDQGKQNQNRLSGENKPNNQEEIEKRKKNVKRTMLTHIEENLKKVSKS